MEERIRVHKGYWSFDIPKIEEKYKAKYIGDFSLKSKEDWWHDKPCAIFYVENPDTSKGHSHYFGLFIIYHDLENLEDNSVFITRGDSAFSEPLTGIRADNGEVIVSCFPHHYIESLDNSVMIDGGRSGYLRYRGDKERLVKIIINKDKLEISDEKNLEIRQ